MTKYDEMAMHAEELLQQAKNAEDPDEAAALEMEAANLWYDIENEETAADVD